MGPFEEALREKFFPKIFGGEEINADSRKIIGHRVKHGGFGIPDPWLSAENAYNTPKADSRELVYSLLGDSVLNYVGHRACVRKASQKVISTKMSVELAEVFRKKNRAGRQKKNRIYMATRYRAWLIAVPHHINVTELYWGELRDNLCLRYGLMPQDIPVTCDGCGKKLLIVNT